MRKYLIVCILLLFSAPASAVLKEKDLARTLGVLRLELERNYKQQKNFIARYELMSKNQHQQLVNYMKKSEQISLMLYSQKSDFTFDVAYACQQATDLYKALHKTNMPYEQIRQRLLNDVARYDSLIVALKQLPPPIDATPPRLAGRSRRQTAERVAARFPAGKTRRRPLHAEQPRASGPRSSASPTPRPCATTCCAS